MSAIATVEAATEEVLLGASLLDIFREHRAELLRSVDLDPAEADPTTFRKDTMRFMGKLCRHLSERHAGDRRVGAALVEWVQIVDEYDAYDSLLSRWHRFDGRERVVRRGKQLFPGPLTSHWDEESFF
jgi:hypothetical protein